MWKVRREEALGVDLNQTAAAGSGDDEQGEIAASPVGDRDRARESGRGAALLTGRPCGGMHVRNVGKWLGQLSVDSRGPEHPPFRLFDPSDDVVDAFL